MADEPIAHTEDGRPIYDNTPTVVAVLANNDEGRLLVIRRANQPGHGLLGLPGGYHMRGETWQQAGAREVFEETGYRIDPAALRLVSMETDEYGNNLVIARARQPIAGGGEGDGEAMEVLFVSEAGPAGEWAFPRHHAAAAKVLEELGDS